MKKNNSFTYLHYLFIPLSYVLSYKNLSSFYFSFISAVSTTSEPTTHKQVVKDPCWVHRMELIPESPPGKNPIGCFLVY
jgi:hypothetical protein